MIKPFLVTNSVFGKTLGSVYAASIQSSRDIANMLWANDRDSLVIFDLGSKFDGAANPN